MRDNFVVFLLLVLTSLFLFGVGHADLTRAISSSQPPSTPSDPPQTGPLEPCPTDFHDTYCGRTGKGASPLIDQAFGKAIEDCQNKLAECFPQQANELAEAKAKCEAVTGCVLTHKYEYEFCDGVMAADCLPPPQFPQTPNTTYFCSAHGSVDNGDYKCKRPAVIPPQEK